MTPEKARPGRRLGSKVPVSEKRISLRVRLLALQPGAMEILPVEGKTAQSVQAAVASAIVKDEILAARKGEFSQSRAWLTPLTGDAPELCVIVRRAGVLNHQESDDE